MSSHCRDMDELVKTEMCWVGPSLCRANLSLLISLIRFGGSFSRAMLFNEWKTLFSHVRQVHHSLPWSCQRETHKLKFVMVDSHVSVASSRKNWPPRCFAALHGVTSSQPWIWKKKNCNLHRWSVYTIFCCCRIRFIAAVVVARRRTFAIHKNRIKKGRVSGSMSEKRGEKCVIVNFENCNILASQNVDATLNAKQIKSMIEIENMCQQRLCPTTRLMHVNISSFFLHN